MLPETTGYRVVYSPTSNNSSAQYHNVSGDGMTSSTVIGGLVLGEEYQFQVQAVVEVGGEVFIGEKSDIKTVTAGRLTSFILDSSARVVFLCIGFPPTLFPTSTINHTPSPSPTSTGMVVKTTKSTEGGSDVAVIAGAAVGAALVLTAAVAIVIIVVALMAHRYGVSLFAGI